MQRETERLIRLVNQLLVLVRADAGTLSISLQPVDLADVARARCQQLSALASGGRVSLLVSVDEAAPACVLGDRDRLAQVLDNLLDNAIRYSPAGSTVAVELRLQRDEWVCSIRDAGPGIPPEHLPFVFERFYRADASRNRQSGGAGLGLAIARALVKAQGGQIRVECPASGGTIARFSLPAHANCHETDNL
jgi:signal transduction histidine kinase